MLIFRPNSAFNRPNSACPNSAFNRPNSACPNSSFNRPNSAFKDTFRSRNSAETQSCSSMGTKRKRNSDAFNSASKDKFRSRNSVETQLLLVLFFNGCETKNKLR
ncbi:hypothetical protein AB3S75_039922 [Citrus x aurantiifolia]